MGFSAPALRAPAALAAVFLFLGGAAALAEDATAQTAPEIKTLSAPQEVLKPAVDFLPSEPVIDGQLDRDLQFLPVRSFGFLYKPNPSIPDTAGDYRLAYGTGFLYVFINVQADRVICRDRGYQNGDGFILSLHNPQPGNGRSSELVRLGYNPTGDPKRPFAQMLWERNDDWPFSPLGDRSSFCVKAKDDHVGFEALLRWEDVPPYHPWLSDAIGFNLFFVKAIGETDLNLLAANLGLSTGMDPFDGYSVLEFARPLLAEGVQSAAVLDRNHLQAGEPLRLKVAAVSSNTAQEQLRVVVQSGEGIAVGRQTVSIDVDPGLSVRVATIDTGDLASGGYTVRWESVANSGIGQAGVTILPSFDAAAVEKELGAVGERISDGSLETLRFHFEEITRSLSKLKPYDTCPALRAIMERLNGQLTAGASGRDVIAEARGIVRRAFRSELDGSLQPYTVFVPEKLEPAKNYPAVVFLHGSDSDDYSISGAIRSCPFVFPAHMFVIAPYGRGKSNAYTKDHAQEDIREAVADALRHYPIDPSRLVLAGFSMGGYGVYRTLYEDVDRYVAAAVFSGHPNEGPEYAPEGEHPDFRRPEFLKPLRGKNIVVIHGGQDRNCPVELTVDLVDVMKRAGIPVLFLLDQEAGHEFPRDTAIRAQYTDWLEAAVREKPQPPGS